MNDTFFPQDEPQVADTPAEPIAQTLEELTPDPPVQEEPTVFDEPIAEPEVTREPIGMQPPVYAPMPEMPYYRPQPPQGYYHVMPRPVMPPVYQPPKAPETKPPVKKEKKQSGIWKIVLAAVACILIGAVCGGTIAYVLLDRAPQSVVQESSASTQPTIRPTETTPKETTPKVTQPRPTVSGEELSPAAVYQNNVPAIVGISNQATYNVFGQTSTTASSGTGFIISEDGEILTNYHVVEGAETLTVTMHDGTEYTAKLVGYEAESDVALLKIEADNLPVCVLGDSDAMYVGEMIAAIGNPLGELTYTMTVGYVSAMDRYVNTDGTPINMMQVDAAINPGNSGGPIFNMRGEVIGIATAKYSGTLSDGATIEGIGFAIPINDVLDILDDLRNDGAVLDRAYMGVVVSTVQADSATYGIDYGVYIQSVEQNGSAYAAGMQAGDIIIAVGGDTIKAYEDLQQTLRKYRAGDRSTITVYRNGQTVQLEITFSAKPQQTSVQQETTTEPTTEYNPWGGFPYGGFGW